ncbi:MAG: precorrin-4 C(11)-methyltransferase, partial [Eubacteriaceae bacterium]
MKETVYMIGAGPGDPELLTIKGKRLIDQADIIIYAGSLVNPQVLADRKADAQVYDSAGMTLDEVIEVMKNGVDAGKKVVRVHTGDPSIYGAIREQMDRLEELDIPYEVVPGVSSFVASAAALKKEFTLPDVSQTVICTRLEGRTPVPETEKLEDLAAHRASMAIFLSVGMIDTVQEKLLMHYPPETPVAIVQRATW